MSCNEKHNVDVRSKLRSMLRDRNLRVTGPRLAVLDVLYHRKGPMTHQEILNVLPEAISDKATVWRVLADLADAGSLFRMDLGDRVWRYELVGGCRSDQQNCSHFLCDDCAKVVCLPPLSEQLNQIIPKELLGAELKIRIAGSCADCVQKRVS